MDGCNYNIITINLPDKDYIAFNLDTGNVIGYVLSEKSHNLNYMTLKASHPLIVQGLPHIKYMLYNNILNLNHTISCFSCSMYDYTLQLFIDLKAKQVIQANLNSEFVTIYYENDENIYEIKNIYDIEKTEYTHVAPTLRARTLELPIISDNMKSPDDLLKRIKTLLVFS